MLSNPLSQIERTKDAYVGKPQELQKRANVTKELVDLLAMQQLKKDLDAVKRNQMMQAQGNPMTIKDQMQQGLMGEYRQQAAKEMGVGPSETDIVQRAQQGMPQGMPQQQPRMAQGMMSQARPVQLAEGGIVAFNKGEGVEDGLTDSQREMREFMERLAERRANAPLVPTFLTEGFTPERIKRRRRSERGEEPSAEIDDGAEAGIASATPPNLYPPKANSFAPTNEETMELDAKRRQATIAQANRDKAAAEQREKEEYGASIQGQLDAVRTSGIAAGISPYQLDQTQREQAEADIAKDPDAAGLAAIERLKKYSKMGENERLLEDMQKRVQATYDETTPQGMDRLIDLLAAGGRGGITGVGVRSGQLRREEAARRRQLDQDVMGIQATTIELNRNFGADAAKAYADSEANIINQKNNARNFLQTADQAEQASLMKRAQLTLEEQRNVRQLYTEQERNRLLSEQITEGNLSSLSKSITEAVALNAAQIMAITEQVNEDPRYAEIRSLDPTDDGDARKLKLLEEARDAEIVALTADLNAMSDALRVRQLRIQAMQDEQVRRLTPREEITLSPEAQKAMASAGG